MKFATPPGANGTYLVPVRKRQPTDRIKETAKKEDEISGELCSNYKSSD